MKTIKNVLASTWLLYYIRKATPMRLVAEFISVLLDVSNSVFVRIYLVKLILDAVVSSNLRGALGIIGVAMTLDYLFSVYESWMNHSYRPISNIRLHEYFQSKLYRSAARVELMYFDRPDYYDKFMLTAQNSDQKAVQYLSTFRMFLIMVLEIAISGGLIIVGMDMLVWLAIIPATLYMILSTKLAKLRVTIAEETQRAVRKKDYVKRVFFLKQFAMDIRITKVKKSLDMRLEESVDEILEKTKPIARKREFLFFCSGIIFFMQYLALIFILTYQAVVLKSISVGEFSLLLGSTMILNNNWRSFSYTFSDLVELGLFVEKFREFLDLAKESQEKAGTKLVSEEYQDLGMDQVSFRYEEEKPVLENLSLQIPKGKKVAIVGPNGAGKSTLIKLILKLYQPQLGSVTWNQEDIKELQDKSYREQFSLILQDYQLYPFSIAENVLLRKVETKEDIAIVESTLKQVGMYEKIKGLPEGINTCLTKEFTKEGVVFSGGENQRIALARAIALDKPIFLMDEPTKAFDPKIEHEMNQLMVSLLEDKTLIIISHRLSTIAGIDYIYLLDQNGIEEQGTHEELMESGGHYAKIYKMQTKAYSMEG